MTRYQMGEIIGRGGMAVVYKAYDEVAEMDVAVKVLHPHLIDDEAVREAFEREAAIMGSLDHPSIAKVHTTISIDGGPAIVMELFEGGDVHQLLMRRGKLSQEEALELAVPILDALHYAHQKGVVHRDIKPHNFLLGEDGQVVLIDFGIGQNEEVMETGADAQLGTVEYMAPERIDGLAIDGRSDLYSLGITLFQLVCGHVPYRADSAAAVMRMHREGEAPDPSFFESSLSRAFCETVQQALALHPEDRFDSAEEMKASLLGESTASPTLSTHARWDRLRQEFGGANSMVAGPNEEEWIVYLVQNPRLSHSLPSQNRALREIFDAYPEHYIGPPLGGGLFFSERHLPVQGKEDSTLAREISGVARGLSHSGAREISERLQEDHLSTWCVRRRHNPGTLVAWGYGGSFICLIIAITSFLTLYDGMDAFSVWLMLPLFLLGNLAMGALVGAANIYATRSGHVWWDASTSTEFALDFRVETGEQNPLLDSHHAQLVERVRSPRIRASLERVMSNALHLRDALRERGVDAEDRLRRAIDEVTKLTDAIIAAESAVANVRPGVLVQEITEIDRRIHQTSERDVVDTLLEKKELLRHQLEARDASQQRLQTLAQRLLGAASEMRSLVQRYRASPDEGSVSEEVILDFFMSEDDQPTLVTPSEKNKEAVVAGDKHL